MRVNVYAEEITERLELITKQAEDCTFYGIRFYLESSDKLYPPKHPDDDSSAITFWVRSNKKGYKVEDEKPLIQVLTNAIIKLESINNARE